MKRNNRHGKLGAQQQEFLIDDDLELEDVVSSTEMTGLIPSALKNQEEQGAYDVIYPGANSGGAQG